VRSLRFRLIVCLYNLHALGRTSRPAGGTHDEGTSMLATFFSRRYSRQGLWSLFLMCALPLHAWTMILAFRDVSWVTDRTNAWDAVGVFSYGLVFALVDSLVIFLVASLLGFLVSARRDREWRVILLTVLVLMLSLWAIAEQLFFLLPVRLPPGIITLLVQSGHPLRTLYAGVIALVGLTVVIPVVLVLRSEKAVRFVRAVVDRLSLLAIFYLLFDAIGLVIVVIRNL